MSDFSKFAEYYDEYMPKIFRYVYSKVSDRELAEDLVSEISMKALEHFDSYNPEFPFGGWFYGIARNHVIDHYKRHARESHVSVDELENVLPDKSNPQKDTEEALTKEQLCSALSLIPEDKRELVTLHYLSGYSYHEIAQMMGKEENAVKVATHRAINELRKILSASPHFSSSPL